MIHMNCYSAAVQATHQPTLQSISRLDAHSAPPLAHVRNELETPSNTEGYLLGRVWHFVLEDAIIWRPRCINRISFRRQYCGRWCGVQNGAGIVEKRSTTMKHTSFSSWWLKYHRFDHQPSTHEADTIQSLLLFPRDTVLFCILRVPRFWELDFSAGICSRETGQGYPPHLKRMRTRLIQDKAATRRRHSLTDIANDKCPLPYRRS